MLPDLQINALLSRWRAFYDSWINKYAGKFNFWSLPVKVSIPTLCCCCMEDICRLFLLFFYFKQKPMDKSYLEQNAMLALHISATERLWNWHCRGLCQHQAFRERIQASVWKWDQIIQYIWMGCSSVCQAWAIWMCLNIWLMGHHLPADYLHCILWVKLYLGQIPSWSECIFMLIYYCNCG